MNDMGCMLFSKVSGERNFPIIWSPLWLIDRCCCCCWPSRDTENLINGVELEIESFPWSSGSCFYLVSCAVFAFLGHISLNLKIDHFLFNMPPPPLNPPASAGKGRATGANQGSGKRKGPRQPLRWKSSKAQARRRRRIEAGRPQKDQAWLKGQSGHRGPKR